jgi:tryptophan synthase beta chain
MDAVAYSQNAVFDAAVRFAHTQGIIPAPESAHAVKGAIDEAIAAREANEERVILFGLSGHGAYDMQAYDDYLNGRLPEVEYRQEDVAAAMAQVPDVPIPEA